MTPNIRIRESVVCGILGLDCGDFFCFPGGDTVYIVVRHHVDEKKAAKSTEYASLTSREHFSALARDGTKVVPLRLESAEFSVKKKGVK